jgi:hypothetical protein
VRGTPPVCRRCHSTDWSCACGGCYDLVSKKDKARTVGCERRSRDCAQSGTWRFQAPADRLQNRCTTPAQAYAALPKATPPGHTADEHFRIRRDTVDNCGKLTLRYASRLHHLGLGTAHAGTKVLIVVTEVTVTVLSTPGYQLIASHTIDPDRNYWRNQ